MPIELVEQRPRVEVGKVFSFEPSDKAVRTIHNSYLCICLDIDFKGFDNGILMLMVANDRSISNQYPINTNDRLIRVDVLLYRYCNQKSMAGPAMGLIKELMVAANEVAATFCERHNLVVPFRNQLSPGEVMSQ